MIKVINLGEDAEAKLLAALGLTEEKDKAEKAQSHPDGCKNCGNPDCGGLVIDISCKVDADPEKSKLVVTLTRNNKGTIGQFEVSIPESKYLAHGLTQAIEMMAKAGAKMNLDAIMGELNAK